MNLNASSSTQPAYTILRIKRKRVDDAPEVLVVEPSTKGSKRRKSTGLDVFQFAETVEASAWRDAEQTRELKNRISTLSKDVQTTESKESPAASVQAPTPSAPGDAELISRKSSTANPTRQYRIVSQDESQPSKRNPRFAREPPKVLASKDLPPSASSSGLKIYDAVLYSDDAAQDGAPEMDKFQSLLQDYLHVSDSTKSMASSSGSTSALSSSSSEDYVYDIFYHRPSALADLSESANVGTVSGLPLAFDDSYDFDSDSEVEDEEDEDSNAEDFYRNDYPDEESDQDSDGSDMFHEQSDNESDIGDRFVPDN